MSKDSHGVDGQEKSCTLNWLKSLMKYESLDLNTANKQLSTMWLFREFQTEGVVQQKARSVKWVLVVTFCSNWSEEEWKWIMDGIYWDCLLTAYYGCVLYTGVGTLTICSLCIWRSVCICAWTASASLWRSFSTRIHSYRQDCSVSSAVGYC